MHNVLISEEDVANWSRTLPFWLANTRLEPLQGKRALEVGARDGGLSIWAALKGMDVVCSDKGGPTERAREYVGALGLQEKVRFCAFDVLADSWTGEPFDVVILKSVLGGLGNDPDLSSQRIAINNILLLLRPGGELWFAENLQASFLHRACRTFFVRWGRKWRYFSIGEMRKLLSGFVRATYACRGFLGAFGRTELQRNWLGRLDGLFLDRLVPQEWRYIMFGVAVKGQK